MDTIVGLSRRERQIMDALYAHGEATVAEVMESIPEPPSYSAVRATLRILEEKGHVLHKQEGQRYVYLPKISAEAARESALQHLVRTFFDGSAEDAAAALLRMSDTELDQAALERLARKIAETEREGR